MKNIINKIFSEQIDEEVHSEFIKFSRGIFENRYLLEGRKQPEKWSIKSSSEFANYFVRRGLENTPGRIKITGAIISTLDLTKDIVFKIEETKRYMGIKQLIINSEIDAKEIINLMNKYPRVFFALSFSIQGYELRIKAKAPKSGKPGTKSEGEPKTNFCFLKTTDNSLVEDLFFDSLGFKEIAIKHTLEVKDIEISENEKDPVKMRERAIRKGVLVRKITVDDKTERKEFPFSV